MLQGGRETTVLEWQVDDIGDQRGEDTQAEFQQMGRQGVEGARENVCLAEAEVQRSQSGHRLVEKGRDDTPCSPLPGR